MITPQLLKNPVMVQKVLKSLVVSYEAAVQKNGPNGGNGHGKSYITDHNDNNIMRLDVFLPATVDEFPDGGVIVYGEGSKRITDMVETAVGHPLYNLL